MAIKDHAFLAAEIENWRRFHKNKNKNWFALVERINEQGQKLWHDLPWAQDGDGWRFTMRLLYLRGLNSFQSAVILASHGLTTDADTLLRSAFEDLFCLAASKEDEALVARLEKAHNVSRRKIATAVSQLPPDLGLDPEGAAKLKAFADALPDDKQQLDFAAIAIIGGVKPIYDVYYRSLSNNAAHPSLDSLERLLKQDTKGNIERIINGPDVSDVGHTLALACVVGFYLLTTMSQLFDNKPVHEITTSLFEEYRQLLSLQFPDRAG